MSQNSIRKALETALLSIDPTFSSAWQNDTFVPPNADTPYQEAFTMFAEPDDAEMGHTMYREQGIFQINLRYPLKAGDAAARAKSKTIRDFFYRSRTLVADGVNTIIERTPFVGQGTRQDDRWVVPMKIRFYAHIHQ